MRSPRVVYGVVAAVLAVAGFVLPRYLADRSAPELGDTVVIPSTPGASVTPSSPPSAPPSTRPSEPGADPVSPRPVRTAGDDDRDDPDDLDDLDDDD